MLRPGPSRQRRPVRVGNHLRGQFQNARRVSGEAFCLLGCVSGAVGLFRLAVAVELLGRLPSGRRLSRPWQGLGEQIMLFLHLVEGCLQVEEVLRNGVRGHASMPCLFEFWVPRDCLATPWATIVG